MGILDWFRRKKSTATTTMQVETERDEPPKTIVVAADTAQCSAKTASGARCSRSAQDGSDVCGIHARAKTNGATTKPAAKVAAKKVPAKKAPAKKTATKKPAAKAAVSTNAQCAAVTAAGKQCSRSSRDNSKYCGLHKGYRAPAETTAPAKKAPAKKAPAKKPAATKAPAKKPAAKKAATRSHVTKYGYKLYQNGNRFFFSKKAQKDVTGKPVYTMPKDKQVVRTPNGMPVLKNK